MTRTLLFLILIPALHLKAQQSASAPPAADHRLYAVFDSAYLNQLATNNPTLLLRWNYYLDHAFVITGFPEKKGGREQFPEVQVDDFQGINILVLEKRQRLARSWDAPAFYRIAGSDKVLMYYSGKDFNRNFRKWLSR